jgi:hypothetical protein
MITAADEINRWKGFAKKVWAGSMGVILALLTGLAVGWVYGRGDLVEDCKYSGAFRVGTQAFICTRKI